MRGNRRDAAPTRGASGRPRAGGDAQVKWRSRLRSKAAGQVGVGVDSAIAQEGPVAADLLDFGEVAFDDQGFLGGGAGARDYFAERIGDERIAPELELAFDSDAVDCRDEHAVGDRVAALNRLPRVDLLGADFFRLAMPPSDGRRIEKNLRTGHRGQPRRLGEPLIPAYERADRTARGRMRDEIEIAGSEVKFFVVARVVGDVHLAVAADDFAGLVDDGGGVVINAGRAPLEDRCDDNYFPRLGDGAERFGGGSGNRLGEIEEFRVLGLTRVMRAEQLLRANDLRAAFGGLLDFRDRLVEIEARLGRTTHLDEPNDDLVSVRCHVNCDSNRASPTLWRADMIDESSKQPDIPPHPVLRARKNSRTAVA